MLKKWLNASEIAKLIRDGVDRIDFTLDTYKEYGECDNFEPTGFYGIRIVKEFDCPVAAIGYWGGGIDSVCKLYDDLEIWINQYLFSEDHTISYTDKIYCEVFK